MADLAARVAAKLVDPTTDANQAGVSAAGHLLVDIANVSDTTIVIDTELPAAAALTDNFANPTAPAVGAFAMAWDGAAWDRVPGSSGEGLLVNLGSNNDVTVTSGTITVDNAGTFAVQADTELPTAAELTDNFANPTAPGVGAFAMIWDGAAWDRAPGNSSDGLLVEISNPGDISSGGPPTNPTIEYVTVASIAAGASDDLVGSEAAGKSLSKVIVWASVPFKAEVFRVDDGVPSTDPVAVGGGQAAMAWEFVPPHPSYITLGTNAGLDAFQITFTNLDNAAAADAHATFFAEG